jgi:hypothetical protein
MGAKASSVGQHGRIVRCATMDEDATADAAFRDRVIRSFIRDGRLVSIPAREKRRLVIYRYLCDQIFTEERAYPEGEVNQRLAHFHPDVATIRRGMVDAGYVTRSAGEYRRATNPGHSPG